ncbi:52 kDa repressor of the inhibitor of the protein kinase [Eumeta japonica]|uniref:52 kDa repressor of the inhibitor of the protein kinase n=1 Tax=Eumeta variegata TaxID=151549 RepID=A0A4C1X410_EUMVA|nr:52 kDa repressor of the inhibitor of the protein kinase [Eumeta japonica]
MVLRRLFDIILALAKSSLALGVHREDLSQEGYHGNFLSFVELVARYDHILRQVLDMPKGSTRYLSATIQNEMIESLGTKLETHLLEQIRASPFFAIIMDTTQDISKGPWLPSYATGPEYWPDYHKPKSATTPRFTYPSEVFLDGGSFTDKQFL